MSLREHPFLYEMSGAPCKFAFKRWIFMLLNAIYDLEDLRICLTVACFVFSS